MDEFEKYMAETYGLDELEKAMTGSYTYQHMKKLWLASRQADIEKLEKLISISQDKPGIDKEQRIWNAHYREGLRVAIAKLKEE